MSRHPKTTPATHVTAIIITHNIGNRVYDTLKAALAECQRCVVVDSASDDDTVAKIRQFAQTHAVHTDDITIITHPQNNMASAQNAGIEEALRDTGTEYILLLDHDSVPQRGMVHAMLTADMPPKTGMRIPHLIERHSDRPARYCCHWGKLVFIRRSFGQRPILSDVLLAIASGSLIHRDVIKQVGLMDETLNIDNVDYDFSLRVIQHGMHIVAVKDAHLHHQLGKCRDHEIAGVRITTSNHRPLRRYYIYRNRMMLWRRYGLRVPAYLLFDICAIAYDLFKILGFEAAKRDKLRAIMRGIGDALSGHHHRISTGTELNSVSSSSIRQLK